MFIFFFYDFTLCLFPANRVYIISHVNIIVVKLMLIKFIQNYQVLVFFWATRFFNVKEIIRDEKKNVHCVQGLIPGYLSEPANF